MPEPLVYIFTRPEFFEKKRGPESIRKKTRGLSGVYAIFTSDWSVCEYVGESYNVNDRLSSHLKNRSFYNIFVVRCPDDKAVRRVLEAILILFFHPRWNIEIIDDMNKKMKMNEVMPVGVSSKEKIKDAATIDAAAQILENLDFAEAKRKKEEEKVKK